MATHGGGGIGSCDRSVIPTTGGLSNIGAKTTFVENRQASQWRAPYQVIDAVRLVESDLSRSATEPAITVMGQLGDEW